MKKLIPFLLLISTGLMAQIEFKQKAEEIISKKKEIMQAPEFKTLAEAAAWADIVAIAQIHGLEYKKIREVNTEGYAYLKILLPYKGIEKDEPIAVVAKGLADNTCYYREGEKEGERYLVFLKKAKDELANVYYGFKPFCQLQILVSDTGQYVLRTPIDDNAIKIDEKLIENIKFSDPDAVVDTSRWTLTRRENYAKTYHCEIIEKEDKFAKNIFLKYTQGVPIYKIRPLLKIKYKPKISSKQI